MSDGEVWPSAPTIPLPENLKEATYPLAVPLNARHLTAFRHLRVWVNVAPSTPLIYAHTYAHTIIKQHALECYRYYPESARGAAVHLPEGGGRMHEFAG